MTSQTKHRSQTSSGNGKREAILAAAETIFLREGFGPASMDEIAAGAGVSKQTIYAHFGTKAELFTATVSAMSTAASARSYDLAPEGVEADELEGCLADYAERQLTAVLSSQAVQLSRLVIGEAGRFPELAAVAHEHGQQPAIAALTREIGRLARLGLLDADDPRVAAIDFNWLALGEPINRAMLLGDEAIPSARSIRAHAEHVAAVFLRAYGRRGMR